MENTSKFVRNTSVRVVFSTPFSVFGNVFKHDISRLIYQIKTSTFTASSLSYYALLQESEILKG